MENQIYLIKIGNDEINLKILYEDNHIIVVEKPVNIPSQGDKTGDIDMLAIVKQYIKEKYNKPGNVYLGLVHRLDRPVGGVMVFAKTSKAAARLSEQVREKVFKKNYLVIVNGKFEKNKGTLQDYLLKNEKTNMSKVVKEGTKNSKYAELDYEVLKYDKELNLSVLKIDLHTGRHHQIRVQLSSRQHSIYGDQKYGGRGHGKQICLWAYKLTIQHPVSKKEMAFMAVPEKEKSWIIEETSFNEKYTGTCESVFTQGNGYLGLRNSLEEQYVNTVRGMFITGTFNKASKDEVTELPNVSDIVNMEIELNGERFSMNENNIKEYSRTLNLYTGETCRNVLWKGKNGDIVHLSFHRFVSYENVHVIGGLELNEATVEVSVDGEPVRLTPIEYKILLLLMKSPGRVFSAEEIYERVWNEKAINTDTIMVHIRNIREKIESCPKEPKYLKVVWGVGYKIEKQA